MYPRKSSLTKAKKTDYNLTRTLKLIMPYPPTPSSKKELLTYKGLSERRIYFSLDQRIIQVTVLFTASHIIASIQRRTILKPFAEVGGEGTAQVQNINSYTTKHGGGNSCNYHESHLLLAFL